MKNEGKTAFWKRRLLVLLAYTFHASEPAHGFMANNRKRSRHAQHVPKVSSPPMAKTIPEEDSPDEGMAEMNRKRSSTVPFSLMETSNWYDEQKPRRSVSSSYPEKMPWVKDSIGLPRNKFFSSKKDWDVHDATAQMKDASPKTRKDEQDSPVFPSTMDDVVEAALYAIHNAMDEEMYQGRLSIEIDGSQHLYTPSQGDQTSSRGYYSAGALRKLSLRLAQRLSTFQSGESDENEDKHRPVAVYFNTIKQTMQAASEFHDLTSAHRVEESENVSVLCLGDQLPFQPPEDSLLRKKRRTSRNPKQEYSHGYVLVVQPTDYNDEHQPPGPSISTIEFLQQLSTKASVMGLATILVSPRFLSSPYYPTAFSRPSVIQKGDGSRELAAFFGGREPALQPAPWLLRDFYPPVFSWIGHGLSLSPPPASAGTAPLRMYTRVALLQSGRGSWHVFGAKQRRGLRDAHILYEYLASTSHSGGRPTREAMKWIFDEFHG